MGSGKDFDTKIYFITDSTGFAEDEFMWRVESALQGGVNIMQLREKNRTTREYILLADKVHIIAKKYKCYDKRFQNVLFHASHCSHQK